MAARSNCAPPDILCTCGETRNYPVSIGLPPVGTESMCTCGRFWRLDSYSFTDRGGTRWSWTSEDVPETDIKAANQLARTLLGIDAALMELGLFAGPERGMA